MVFTYASLGQVVHSLVRILIPLCGLVHVSQSLDAILFTCLNSERIIGSELSVKWTRRMMNDECLTGHIWMGIDPSLGGSLMKGGRSATLVPLKKWSQAIPYLHFRSSMSNWLNITSMGSLPILHLHFWGFVKKTNLDSKEGSQR